MPCVTATFRNSLNEIINVFWVDEGGKEVPAHENPVQAGASLYLQQ